MSLTATERKILQKLDEIAKRPEWLNEREMAAKLDMSTEDLRNWVLAKNPRACKFRSYTRKSGDPYRTNFQYNSSEVYKIFDSIS